MTADIITIGDELLIGQVVNTNAAWLGETLSGIGIEPARMLTVSDEIPAIQKALSTSDADVILFTGGLGPTHDDVTKVAIAEYFGQELKHDEFVMQTIVSRFEQRGRHMPESNRAVALVPEGFEVVENPIGTAPGLWYEHKDRVVVMMPGVPYEMKAIVETGILPRFKGRSGRRAIAQRTILTAGVGESTLAREIGDLEPFRQPDTRLAYLPSPRTGVRLRITALAETQESANDKLLGLIDRLHRRIGKYVYGEGDDTLEAAVGRLLTARRLSIALAESCTGGLISDRLTDVPGSSRYVLGGVVAYSNEAKVNLLDVRPLSLETMGAVSEAVALEMAEGVRRRFGSSIGLATTGIAGPTGGTPEKPVGTVWFAYVDEDTAFARRFQLTKDRLLNKTLASTYALHSVRRRLAE